MPMLPRARAPPGLIMPSLRPASFVCASCHRSQQQRQFSGTRAAGASSSSSHAPPPSAPPPATGYARLTSRRLLSVAGRDAAKFLHGIITQPVVNKEGASTSDKGAWTAFNAPAEARTGNAADLLGFYAGFLNATGRVLHDVFIYRDVLGLGTVEGKLAPGVEAFIVEVDADQANALANHLKRYQLRSKVSYRILFPGECSVWQVWAAEPDPDSDSSTSSTQQEWLAELKNSIVLPDNRAPGMGYRVLRRGDGELDLGLERSSDETYRIRRYLLGVAEGQAEILREQALPLDSNMDVMGGIDFRKGCYVGQELTIRTRHRGVVRKRILPCLLYPSTTESAPQQLEYKPYINEEGDTQVTAEDIPSGSSIGRIGAKGRSAGTWLRGVGNIGLALCRLPIMTDVELPGETATTAPFDPAKDEFTVNWGADEETGNNEQSVKLKAFVPDWLRKTLPEDVDHVRRAKRW
ncbi:Aminomethyltransferase folate-binding domain-containing protein [Hypomontagnella monticulosa]|nr:Aminomethyltransferase folate-binding domain-containing protein [Hypomontagnella monticulosa]